MVTVRQLSDRFAGPLWLLDVADRRGLVAAAVVIYIVGRLNLGMTVDGFVPAIIAAAAIAIIGGIIAWLLSVLGITIGGGWLGAIINLIVAAVVLLLADRFVKGMKVNGFVGAIVAAIAIGVVTWIINWLLGLLGLA
jgi:putative membrane protein